MLGNSYGGSGYGYAQFFPPPGGIFPCNPYGYGWGQQQVDVSKIIYAANPFAIASQVMQPPVQGLIEHKAEECKEFAWLRRRVKEILWK